jgi:GntR family transcriptional regulator, transcriptional repressor for pyruvate dehydrogenase complex
VQKSNIKVYQEVLEQIKLFIDKQKLSPGDRLPSERYLAETLNAGRSSVREALRAIELLGIIETRQGEGTFLKSYQPYTSVELLSSFILRESRTKEELMELKKLLEEQGIKYAMKNIMDKDISELQELLMKKLSFTERHYYFFSKLFQTTKNNLLLKVWQLIDEFARSIHSIEYNKEVYKLLIKNLKDKDKSKIGDLINQLYGYNGS